MNNNFLILGSDSFIAQQFITCLNTTFWKGISRTFSNSEKEKIIFDLFSIPLYEFKEFKTVINFAAIVHRPSIKDTIIYNEVNYKLAIQNAQKAKLAGVKLFIQMSSIAVYGNSSEISITTAYNPINPYGISKLRADEELLAMQDDHFKVAILRPPMVYGGGKAPGNMMRLIKLADKGIPLPFKDIDNRRDFINVNNLVQYLSIIAEKQLNGIYLISDQQPVSTEYLLKTIGKYLGREVSLFKTPEIGLKLIKRLRPNEYFKLFGTLSIQSNFPYEHLIKRHSVEEGILEMIGCYKKINNNDSPKEKIL